MDSESDSERRRHLIPGSPDDPAASPPKVRVPDHEVVKRIGQGSYGGVYLARSVAGPLRAVKVVWRSSFSSERPYEREFSGIKRFEPISRSHPGVVEILHIGRDAEAGCFYCVMELADPVLETDGVAPARQCRSGHPRRLREQHRDHAVTCGLGLGPRSAIPIVPTFGPKPTIQAGASGVAR
jgi:serine/threonine protein kinase